MKPVVQISLDITDLHEALETAASAVAAGFDWLEAGTPLREVVAASSVPLQAVGGLSLEEASATPAHGAPQVVIGAPLAIDAGAFRHPEGDIEAVLRRICERVHAHGDAPDDSGSPEVLRG